MRIIYTKLIVDSILLLVSGLSLRLILKPRLSFSMFRCTPNARLTDRSPIFVLYLLVASFFWNICENFSAVADTFCVFKSLFLAYTNDILDQIYYNFFTFYGFEHAVDQNSSTLSVDVCFNAKLQQLGKDLPPKT